MWGLKGIWVAYALAFVSLCIIQGLYYQFIWKKKEDQSSYLECIKPYKKSHQLMAFSFKPYFIHLVTMVEAR